MKALLCVLMLCSSAPLERIQVAWNWAPRADAGGVEFWRVCVNERCRDYPAIHRQVWVYLPRGPFLITVRACNRFGCSEPDTLSDVRP